MRILLAEDDVSLRRGLHQVLKAAGHQISVAEDGSHADTLLAAEDFDLVVLDLGLPRMDGLTVLERLRRRSRNWPVLIISARDQTSDRVRGLNIGADDYLTKPFELSEFEARVRALLRRGQGSETQIGDLVWSWTTRLALVRQAPLIITAQETAILESLIQQHGKIVTKTALAGVVGGEDSVDVDNLVEVNIHRLRKKLAEAGVEIRNVRGVGYIIQKRNETL